jgi:hypothetical protein
MMAPRTNPGCNTAAFGTTIPIDHPVRFKGE